MRSASQPKIGSLTRRAAGQAAMSYAGGVTTLKLDVNGDRVSDLDIVMNGQVTDTTGWLL